ncbi:thiol reductase thioredoxin [bacterium]|nr:thiol reductase thioredoxin [bacterium]
MIKELNSENFIKETQSGLKLVEFFADWCGFCTRQEPILKELDKVWVGRVNTDENRDIAKKYKINSLPSFVLLKNGEEVDRFTGLHSKFDIMNIINKHLK